jgi:TPR repeat protein
MAFMVEGQPAFTRWLLRDAANDDFRAAAELAYAHVTGAYDVVPDIDRGMEDLEEIIRVDPSKISGGLARLEATIGRAQAEWLLGSLLYEGKYVPANPDKASQLIRRAAAEHNENAIAWLAKMNEK